jgi:2,3-bisphosphoglycerate-dependent phosphoglycerate mutase
VAEPPRGLTGFLHHEQVAAYGRMVRVTAPVYLVRHGQSEWNVLRLTQGQTAHPRLTALGHDQARAAAERIAADLALHGQRCGRLLSSDLARAAETAAVVAARLGTDVVLDERLREQHLGSLQGRDYEHTWAAAETHDWSDPTLPVAGGESLDDVRRRMAAVLDGLDGLDGLDRSAPSVLVSHGDAIRVALAHLAGVPPHLAPWVEVGNGDVARVTGTAGTPRTAGDIAWLR